MPTELLTQTNVPFADSKAQRTRVRILDLAQREASLKGVDALTLGGLANICGLSKSGLNAHFGSKEALQIAVIDAVAHRFHEEVANPALTIPVGQTQLLAIMDYWLAWSDHPDRVGGCQLISASFDFDGFKGPVRDHLARHLGAWREAIRRAVDAANQRESTVFQSKQMASLAFGLYTTQHIERFLLGDETAAQRARQVWSSAIRI